jgi:tripartite-type tricarboxylate transporter receptor subunit TctC
MSGEVQFMSSAIVAGLQQWRAGKVRALGLTSAKRSSAAPDLPTVAEAGVPGYQVLTWYGVLAPAGVPRGTVAIVNAGIRKAASLPEVTERLMFDGAEPVSDTPAAFGKHLEAEIGRFRKLAREAGLKEGAPR